MNTKVIINNTLLGFVGAVTGYHLGLLIGLATVAALWLIMPYVKP